jgi:Arc/MetJ-type ribon-helix-helix transcriptional regulator
LDSPQDENEDSRKVSVKINRDLYNEIAKNIENKESSFSSVEEFVNYAVQMAIGKKTEAFTEEDTEAVTARLKALGYV